MTKATKLNTPSVCHYDEPRNIGSFSIEGGAPNNFLLMKNDRLVAPFHSTVPKGWISIEKGKEPTCLFL